MMGAPVTNEYAEDYLKLWGQGQSRGGPRWYPSHSSHVPVARGVSAEWYESQTELVGFVVSRFLTERERRIVKMYYQPHREQMVKQRVDENGDASEYVEEKIVRCNVTSVIKRLKAMGKDERRADINKVLDCAIGQVRTALSLPAPLMKAIENERENKKVCNF